jgi:hypothetical protein
LFFIHRSAFHFSFSTVLTGKRLPLLSDWRVKTEMFIRGVSGNAPARGAI